jgi:WD40 repeat protein
MLLLTLQGHSSSINSVAFSPDGQRILTGSADNTAKVWEAASGKELLTLKEHIGPIAAVAFSPDGQRIVTSSWDGTVKVWEAATVKQVAAWQVEEQAARQQTAQLRQAEEEEAKAATETAARELAVLAGTSVSALKHQSSTQPRPLIPGDPGAIRQWLVLAPMPFQGNANLNVLRQQISHEAGLRPRASSHPSEAPGTLAWTSVQLGEVSLKLDFVELLNKIKPGSATEHQAAYAVSYVLSERPQTNLTLLVGSDDTARIYLNEKEIYRQLNPRMWQADQDEVSGVELKAGLNVLVFKVANDTGSWSGSVRFLDNVGQPVPGLTVTLDPEAKDRP